MDRRISIIVILVILIFAVYMYRRSSGKKETAKGGRGKSNTKKGKRGKPNKAAAKEEKEEDESPKSADKDLVSDARELYGLVHADLAQGMQLDEFEDLAGDLAGENPEEVYIELKQLYTKAIDDNKDPSKTVTMNDYAKILDETD